jgi:hypothetical protein
VLAGLPSTFRLRAIDRAFHRPPGDPLPTGFLFDFEGTPPALGALRARIAERAGTLAALRYRVGRDGRHARRVDHVAFADHVREVDLPADKDGAKTGRLMVSAPFVRDGRPAWEVWLIRRGEGAYTLGFRADHVLVDGALAAHLARVLLADQRADPPRPHRPRTPRLRGVVGALAEGVAALRSPPIAPAFAGTVTGSAAVSNVDAPLTALRAIGRAGGASVNDVYLGALAHAVHRLHRRGTGLIHPPLPVTMAMSTRAPGRAAAPGNALVSVRLQLPCHRATAAEALAAVVARTARVREDRRRDVARLTLAALPPSVGARVATYLADPTAVTTMVSNMDLGPEPLHHAGSPALAATMFAAPPPGVRCYIALARHGDTVRLSVFHDEALTHLAHLGEHWLAALADLAPPGGPRRSTVRDGDQG